MRPVAHCLCLDVYILLITLISLCVCVCVSENEVKTPCSASVCGNYQTGRHAHTAAYRQSRSTGISVTRRCCRRLGMQLSFSFINAYTNPLNVYYNVYTNVAASDRTQMVLSHDE